MRIKNVSLNDKADEKSDSHVRRVANDAEEFKLGSKELSEIHIGASLNLLSKNFKKCDKISVVHKQQ